MTGLEVPLDAEPYLSVAHARRDLKGRVLLAPAVSREAGHHNHCRGMEGLRCHTCSSSWTSTASPRCTHVWALMEASQHIMHNLPTNSDPKAKTAEDVKEAVESIPAFVERMARLLILVPVCVHQACQGTGSIATWHRRAWYRLELQTAVLKCGT